MCPLFTFLQNLMTSALWRRNPPVSLQTWMPENLQQTIDVLCALFSVSQTIQSIPWGANDADGARIRLVRERRNSSLRDRYKISPFASLPSSTYQARYSFQDDWKTWLQRVWRVAGPAEKTHTRSWACIELRVLLENNEYWCHVLKERSFSKDQVQVVRFWTFFDLSA
jgi:hypothetical protein